MEDIQNATTAQLRDTSADDLVQEINDKRSKLTLFPFAAALWVAGALAVWAVNLPEWMMVGAAILGLCATVMARHRDVMEKTVVLLYDLEEQAQSAYQQLQNAFDTLLACRSVELMRSESHGADQKYHAGTNNIAYTEPITLSRGQVSNLKTNIEIPKIATRSQTLAFMPDRLLVFDSVGVAAVPYDELSVDVSSVEWRQYGRLPSDAQVIDYTWRYVNKNGEPDKRFANNPRVPIALYEQVYLRSGSGLNALLNCSHTGVGEPLKQAMVALGSASQAERWAADTSTSRLSNAGASAPGSVHGDTLSILR